MAVRVYRVELSGTVGAPSSVRVYRVELLGSGTTGTQPQVRVYRVELVGSRGGFTVYDATAGAWEDALALWEYDLPTTTWVQVQ